MFKERKGISLVALVITVIVLIIITGVVVLNMGGNGIVSRAQEATFKSNISTLQEELVLKIQKEKIDAVVEKREEHKINVVSTDTATIKSMFPGISNDLIGKVYIEDNEIKFIGLTEQEDDWARTVSGRLPRVKNANEIQIVNGEYVDANNATAVIPKGFKVVTGLNVVAEGLVIEDESGNQFVWVPVNNGYNLTNMDGVITPIAALTFWEGCSSIYGSTGSYHEPYINGGVWQVAEWNAMYSSVMKNKGFYIGRYEAGMGAGGMVTLSKANLDVFHDVSWSSRPADMWSLDEACAPYLSRQMYPISNTNYGVASTLMYGIQYGTVYNWAEIVGKSRALNSYTSVSAGRTGAVYADGITYDKEKNIYDLLGNVTEWSMSGETSGFYDTYGGNYQSLHAFGGLDPSDSFPEMGFRVALYIK